MPVEKEELLAGEIIAVLQRYSGRRCIAHDQLLGRDVGIYGGDSVQLLDTLEGRFDVDLDPLVKAHTFYLPPTWWDRLRGRSQGAPVADMTVRELVDYIVANVRERETDPTKSL